MKYWRQFITSIIYRTTVIFLRVSSICSYFLFQARNGSTTSSLPHIVLQPNSTLSSNAPIVSTYHEVSNLSVHHQHCFKLYLRYLRIHRIRHIVPWRSDRIRPYFWRDLDFWSDSVGLSFSSSTLYPVLPCFVGSLLLFSCICSAHGWHIQYHRSVPRECIEHIGTHGGNWWSPLGVDHSKYLLHTLQTVTFDGKLGPREMYCSVDAMDNARLWQVCSCFIIQSYRFSMLC